MIIKYDNKAVKYTNKWVSIGGVTPPPVPTVYSVYTLESTGGSVSAVPNSGISGTEVTLSNTPATNYTFSSYSVTGATLKNTNQFDIGNSDVYVKGNFTNSGTADIGGKFYRVAEMPDGKIWMCENLDYGSSGVYYNNDEQTYGWNGLKYGKLYTWNEAVAAANTISGWHIPTEAEWDALVNTVGGSDVAGTKLKSSTGWSSGNGTDDYGFSAFPAGRWFSPSFYELGSRAWFWTATEYWSSNAFLRRFNTGASIYSGYDGKTSTALSVRLVKDS